MKQDTQQVPENPPEKPPSNQAAPLSNQNKSDLNVLSNYQKREQSDNIRQSMIEDGSEGNANGDLDSVMDPENDQKEQNDDLDGL